MSEDWDEVRQRWGEDEEPGRCGHGPLRDLCFAVEAPWRMVVGATHGQTVEDFGDRVRLDNDLCVVDGEAFFIRGNIELKILGTEDVFTWGVWCSLSRESFEHVVDRWDAPEREWDEPRFGWLMADLPGYANPPGTWHLKTMVHQRGLGKVPWVEVEPGTPLSEEQVHGITVERWRELAAAARARWSEGSAAAAVKGEAGPRTFLCRDCGQVHEGMPDLTFHRPGVIAAMAPEARRRFYETDDACAAVERDPTRGPWWAEVLVRLGLRRRPTRWGAPFYLRAVLEVPLVDGEPGKRLGYGPWVEVERDGFMAATRQRPGEVLRPFRGVLVDELPGFPGSGGIEVELDPGDGRLRPLLRALGEGGGVARAQREGVTVHWAWECVKASGMSR